MSDQQYVYTIHETDASQESMSDLDAIINEYAREGWQLAETLGSGGTTVGLVFEREM